MKKENFVFHSNSNHPSGIRVTVIGEYADGVLNMSASRCSNKDAFEKKIGRKLATDRLNDGNFNASLKSDEMTLGRFISAACAVGDAVINYGVDVKITLIESSKLFTEMFDGGYHPIGEVDEFTYMLA